MALDALIAAPIIHAKYLAFLAEADTEAKVIAANFPQTLASLVDDTFQQGDITANVDISPAAGTLVFNDPMGIGQACADYWALAIGTGEPQSCTAIASVSNDAQKIGPMIEANLAALCGQTVEEDIPYQGFCNALFDAVKTIKWTIVELDPSPCSATLVETIT